MLPLNYSKDGARSSRKRIAIILVTFAISLGSYLVWFINHPHGSGSRPVDNILVCQRNLRMIGNALTMYAAENGDRLPDSLIDLVTAEDLPPYALVCLLSNDSPATGPTTTAITDKLLLPGHVSYIYLGKGKQLKSMSPKSVLVYEPIVNHGTLINVLFPDSHVEFFNGNDTQRILDSIATTTQPTDPK